MNINSDSYYGDNRISTALLLAAGTGSRLFPLTKSSPKCLTLVHDKSILERLINNLKEQGFKRLVIVTGYKEECIRDFLGNKSGDLSIEYINSPLYRTTNNIYSLWMARNIINEPFVLFESDLILNTSLLDGMVFPDRIAISQMHPWLNGTTVSVNNIKQITQFHKGTTETYTDIRYKTVNVYSFSLSSWIAIVKKLNKHISEGNVNCYYETVFAEMIEDKSLSFESVSFDSKPWYEIDTMGDLVEAKKLFPVALKRQPKLEIEMA
jgi:choline kinase